MTAGEAIGQARALRPGCEMTEERMRSWLRREDGEIRARLLPERGAEELAQAGADLAGEGELTDSTVLLVPFPFDGMYPHYLCAMIDAALGENDRYAGAMTRCNAILGEFAAWLRRSCPPPVRRMRW